MREIQTVEFLNIVEEIEIGCILFQTLNRNFKEKG